MTKPKKGPHQSAIRSEPFDESGAPGHSFYDGRADVALVGFALQQPAFGLVHGGHDRRIAGVVLVDADAQVNLVLAGILPEGLHQLENPVLWQRFQSLKHGIPPSRRLAWFESGSGGRCPAP